VLSQIKAPLPMSLVTMSEATGSSAYTPPGWKLEPRTQKRLNLCLGSKKHVRLDMLFNSF